MTDDRPWTDEEKAEFDEHPEHFFSTREEWERAASLVAHPTIADIGKIGTRVMLYHSFKHSKKGDWVIARPDEPDWWLWSYRNREDSVALCKLMQWEIVEK
jgi:hypothetical protein